MKYYKQFSEARSLLPLRLPLTLILAILDILYQICYAFGGPLGCLRAELTDGSGVHMG